MCCGNATKGVQVSGNPPKEGDAAPDQVVCDLKKDPTDFTIAITLDDGTKTQGKYLGTNFSCLTDAGAQLAFGAAVAFLATANMI